VTTTQFRVTMMLCDHAQVAGGKLFISGGGWSITSTPTQPSAVALLLRVPWGDANRKVKFSLRLYDSDGQVITQAGPAGTPAPVATEGELEVGRPAGLVEGSTLDMPIALNIPPLVLQPDQRFVWHLELNNESKDEWQLPFQTRGIQIR
jgi:hypothetical protein